MGERIPVVVTGGSLVGLSTAVFLADHGVRCVVVERHPDTAIHPRARGYTARTAEVLRRAGLEERLREAGAFGEKSGALIRARDLSDENFQVLVRPEAATPPGLSPCAMFACDQDRLEPILLQRARELGAQVRFSTELTGFTQDADGVTVTLRHPDGSESAVACDYLVAADGAHSGIRDVLGIGVDQIGRFGHAVSILFNADLDEVAKDRHFFACVVQSVEAGILVRRDDRRWQLVAAFHPERGERLGDFTDDRCVELIRTATGQPDLEASVTSVLPWEVTAQVAERLSEGRVFIAGDAAHTTTPWGGLGANTGIQDADNLAWKLAAVLNGAAPASLLDTYHSERHPVAEVTVRHAVSLLKQQHGAIDRYAAVTLGYRYVEGALVDDAGAGHDGADRQPGAAAELVEDPARPSGRPGTRAPHVVLQRAGKELSTLDLFGDGFTLLAGPKADGWFEAAGEVAEHSPIRLTAYRIGQDADGGPVDVEDRWSDAYGVQADGAVLVRPDGFIAWRADGDADAADAAPILAGVLTTVLRGGARAGGDRCQPLAAAGTQGA